MTEFEDYGAFAKIVTAEGLEFWVTNHDGYPEFTEMHRTGSESEIILLFSSLDVQTTLGCPGGRPRGFELLSTQKLAERKYSYRFVGEVLRIDHRWEGQGEISVRAIIGGQIPVCANLVVKPTVMIHPGSCVIAEGWFNALPVREWS